MFVRAGYLKPANCFLFLNPVFGSATLRAEGDTSCRDLELFEHAPWPSQNLKFKEKKQFAGFSK